MLVTGLSEWLRDKGDRVLLHLISPYLEVPLM